MPLFPSHVASLRQLIHPSYNGPLRSINLSPSLPFLRASSFHAEPLSLSLSHMGRRGVGDPEMP